MLNQPTALIKKVPEPDYPWDRQPNESPQAFEAFATYRDMAYQRSLAAVGWKLHKSKTPPCEPSTFRPLHDLRSRFE